MVAIKRTNTKGKPVVVLRPEDVCHKLSLSQSKLRDMVAQGQFPHPFKIVPGGRAVGWLERQVDDWIMGRKKAAAVYDAEEIR